MVLTANLSAQDDLEANGKSSVNFLKCRQVYIFHVSGGIQELTAQGNSVDTRVITADWLLSSLGH